LRSFPQYFLTPFDFSMKINKLGSFLHHSLDPLEGSTMDKHLKMCPPIS